MSLSLKHRIIKSLEKVLFFRLILFVLLLIRDDIRKKGTHRIFIIWLVFIYFIKALQNQAIFLIFNVINKIRESRLALRLRKFFVSKISYYKPYYHQIDLPVNLVKEDERHYYYRDYFITKPLKIKSIKNCHIYLATEFGIVFRKFHILRDSIHGKLDKRNIKILKSYHEMVFENYINNKFRSDGNIIKADNRQNYLLIHNWFNYYHWITETLYRYFSMPEGSSKNYTLVFPETLKENGFVDETLLSFPNTKIEYFSNNSIIHFDHIHIIGQKKYCSYYEPEVLLKIKAHFTNYIETLKISPPIVSEKIFISRKLAERRNIVNQNALEIKLTAYGFTIIDFEDYSFSEQVSIMQHCKYLAGVHGSGFTNMIFMPEGSNIIELMPKPANSNSHHSLVYWRLAGCLKHTYYYYFCKKQLTENKALYANRKHYHNAEFHTFHLEVDIDAFENQLRKILKLG